MRIDSRATEVLLVLTAVGLAATLAAPWIELRGTYAAWRLDEWHAFWRGAGAFQLSDIVADNYAYPIEFATLSMQQAVSVVFILGSVLAAWHSLFAIVLLIAGANRRLRGAVPFRRVALETGVIVLVSIISIYVLGLIFALPSSIALKVDFRAPSDIHTDSLVWSSLEILPVAPALSVLAALAELAVSILVLKRTRAQRARVETRA